MRDRKITEHAVRAMKPAEARYTVTEDGLTVEVHPSGKRAFYCKYREHGRQQKEYLGEYHDQNFTVKDAREKVLAIRHRLTIEQAPVKQSSLTLKEFIEGPFKQWATDARRDGAATMQRVKHHFVTSNPQLASTKLKELSRQQLDLWILATAKTHKAASVRRTFGDLRRVLNLAVEWGHLRRSPAVGVRPPAVDDAAQKLYLDDDEFGRLSKAIERWTFLSLFGTPMERHLHPSWFPVFVRLALNTGGRKGEILKLRWTDVDQANREITFKGVSTKNAKTRRVPISDALLETLKRFYSETREDDAEETFTADAPVFPVDSIRKPWAKLQSMAKISHVTPHTLRHHVASQLVLRGAALSVVRDLLGHQNIAVTSRYLSVRTSDKLEALNLL
jgi:integrase